MRITGKRITILKFILFALSLFGIYVHQKRFQILPNYEDRQYLIQLLDSHDITKKKIKLILLWNNLWDKDNWGFPRISKPKLSTQLPTCKQQNCIITDEKYFTDVADAIVVHAFKSVDYLPSKRNLKQRWVFLIHEPPNNIDKGSFDRINSIFNWTQTYRFDSDIPMHYGTTIKRLNNIIIDYENILKWKKRPIAWMVSNCDDASKRLDYVKELMNYISVDVYGKCAKLLGQNNQCKRFKEPCKDMISQKYWFYLAFENCLN